MTPPYLSVVIPAYNEAGRIRTSLDRVAEYLRRPDGVAGRVEILVVDDASRDATASVVEEAARRAAEEAARGTAGAAPIRLLRNDVNRGKGYSIKHGFLMASGTYVLLSDADFSTPIEDLPRLLEPVAGARCDVAIGSRGLDSSAVEVPQPFWRQTMGRTFNRIVRLMTGLPFRDTQCGFKVMRREAALPLFRAARVERFAYDVEILFLARKAGLRILEIPVRWRDAPGSKVHPVVDSMEMLKDVTRILWRDRRGRYGRIGSGA